MRRIGFFGEFRRHRHRSLLLCLGRPPVELFGDVLFVAPGDPAVLDDVGEIVTGGECLRSASGDLFQAHLLADDVAERDPHAVRDHDYRTGFTHELRHRGINALLPGAALAAEALRLLIDVLAEKESQEERRRDLVPLLHSGIDVSEHLSEAGVGKTVAFCVEPTGEGRK